jgi:hypothetical protein
LSKAGACIGSGLATATSGLPAQMLDITRALSML